MAEGTAVSYAEHGVCTQTDPELFFSIDDPDKKGSAYLYLPIALSFCAQCPVRKECLDEAISENIPWGIWGGSTWTQRRYIKRGLLTVEQLEIDLKKYLPKENNKC